MLWRKGLVSWLLRSVLEWAPGERLGFNGEGGLERSHRGSNVWKETVIIILHPYELL